MGRVGNFEGTENYNKAYHESSTMINLIDPGSAGAGPRQYWSGYVNLIHSK